MPNCLVCAVELESYRGRGRRRLYCSPRCRDLAIRRRDGQRPLAEYLAAKARPERKCAHCEKLYRPKRANCTSFCSRECAFTAKATQNPRYSVVRPCADCGKFVRGNAIRCETHRREHELRQNRDTSRKINMRNFRPETRVCFGCGVSFSPVYGHSHRRACSEACSRRDAKRARNARLRRARCPNASVRRIAIFDLAGWKCVYCGVDTPRSLLGTIDARAPELDHVTPIARGGKHSLYNVVCACRRCNGLKNDSTVAQFALALHAAAPKTARA